MFSIYPKHLTVLIPFTEKYVELLQLQAKKSCTYCIVGDFNINVLKAYIKRGIKDYVDQIYSSGANMVINKPTRVPLHTVTVDAALRKKK